MSESICVGGLKSLCHFLSVNILRRLAYGPEGSMRNTLSCQVPLINFRNLSKCLLEVKRVLSGFLGKDMDRLRTPEDEAVVFRLAGN